MSEFQKISNAMTNASGRQCDSDAYTKPENHDKNYHGEMKRYKMIAGVEHTEDSKGNWTPILFVASVGEMPSICGSAGDATEIRKNAEREPLKAELERLGYDDIKANDCATKYGCVEARRKILYQAKKAVKHIGDKAVQEWTNANIKSYLSGDRKVAIEPRPMKTQEDLDSEVK